MKDIQFKITSIQQERNPFGLTLIKATSLEDNIHICISMASVLATRKNIKETLIYEYYQRTTKSTEKPIEVGDIL